MMKNLRVKNRGFSLIELVVVMLIGSIVVAAIYSVVFGSKDVLVRGERDARTSYRARRTMRRLVEDFRLAGYGLPGGELGIVTARENELTMVADLDRNGMTETIKYYLSETSELGNTPNPNDRILYKSVNGEDPGLVLAVGISSLSLGFYDPERVDLLDPATSPKRVNPLKDLNDNGKNDLSDIRLITIRVVFELAMPDKHGEYRPYAVSSSISPRNLKLLGGGGGGSSSDSMLVLDASPDMIRGDGITTSNLTATATASGSPMIGEIVYCYVISGEGNVSPSPMIDNGDGTYSSTYTSPTTMGEAIIMAVDSVASLSATTKITITGPPVGITVRAEPDTVVADSNSTSLVTATVVDSFGTPVPGQTVDIEITDNNTGASMQGTVLDKGNGDYTRIYKASVTGGPDEVTATCEGHSASVNITAREGPCEIQIWAVPETLIADTSEYSMVKALVLSCAGDSIPGQLVTIDFEENLAGVSWVSDVVDSGNGIYTRMLQASEDSGLVILVASDPPLYAYDTLYVKGLQGDIYVGKVIKVMLGDFEEDGNGDIDIFVVSEIDPEVSVFLNTGKANGMLKQMDEITFDAEGDVADFAVGNFDSLKTDVCMILSKAKKIELAMNDQNGGFEEESFKYDISKTGMSGAVGDIDGDGDTDVLAGTDDKRTEIWLNDGDAGLTFHAKLTHFNKPNAICLVDFGEDTLDDLDIVVGTENEELEVFFNDGGGSFHTDHIYAASGKVTCVAVGDLNSDTYVDIVCGTGKAKKFDVWLNNGDGTFPLTPDYSYNVSDQILSIAIGDANEDTLGDLDVVVGPRDGLMTVWFNDGTGALTVSEKTYPHPGKITGLDTGDLGEDDKGDTDIVTGTDEGGEGGSLRMYLGKGDGTFLKRE